MAAEGDLIVPSPSHVARPYSDFARAYDRALGLPAFAAFRGAFEELVRRYGISFRSVADIGCGTGLFAGYLARSRGVPVVAVDISPEMLKEAEKNTEGTCVALLRQDIRALCLPAPVDLITANFDTVNHLLRDTDIFALFGRVKENLNPGGFFMFDAVTPASPIPRGMVFVSRVPLRRSLVVQATRWGARSITVTITRRERSGAVVRELHRERPYSVFELARMLRAAGLSLRGVHDAATLEVAHRRSPRVIVVAQRPSEGARARSS